MAEALMDAEACSTTMDVNLAPPVPEEMTIQDKDNERLIIVEFDNDYMRTLPAIICVLQVVVSVIALMCVVSSGRADDGFGGYLLLPLAGYLRLFIFVAVCSLLTSCLRLLVTCSGIIHSLPLVWDLFDLIVYIVLSVLCLLGSSLLVRAIQHYKSSSSSSVTKWTIEELIVAAVFGYIDMLLFGISAGLAYIRWRGSAQFLSRRFSSSASQRSQQSAASGAALCESLGAASPAV